MNSIDFTGFSRGSNETICEKVLSKICHVIQILGYYSDPHIHFQVLENHATGRIKALFNKRRHFLKLWLSPFCVCFPRPRRLIIFFLFISLPVLQAYSKGMVKVSLTSQQGSEALQQHSRHKHPQSSAGYAERLEKTFSMQGPFIQVQA